MKEASITNFGLLIAYLVPGFTTLWGLSYFSPQLHDWLHGLPADPPTVGGFLYVTLASIAAGLTISTVRWATLDTLHHKTGVRQPNWDFSRLQQNVAAFDTLIQIHYRYYQFYGNMLVSLAVMFTARRFHDGAAAVDAYWLDLGFVLLAAVFFAGSRDTLCKYYTRTAALLAKPPVRRRNSQKR